MVLGKIHALLLKQWKLVRAVFENLPYLLQPHKPVSVRNPAGGVESAGVSSQEVKKTQARPVSLDRVFPGHKSRASGSEGRESGLPLG